MVKRYRFLFVKNFTNNHDQIIIPKGTSGTLMFDGSRARLSCDRVVKSQGTAWFIVQFEHIKNSIFIKEMLNMSFEKKEETDQIEIFPEKIENRILGNF